MQHPVQPLEIPLLALQGRDVGPDIHTVEDILVDTRGRVWVATRGSGLLEYDLSSDQLRVHLPNRLGDGANVYAVSTHTADLIVYKRDAETGNRGPETGNSVPPPEQKGPDMEELARALNVANQSIGRDLRFEVDMESGRSVIQVLDRDTGEVIRQIPPEKTDIYMSGNGDVQLRLYNRTV